MSSATGRVFFATVGSPPYRPPKRCCRRLVNLVRGLRTVLNQDAAPKSVDDRPWLNVACRFCMFPNC